MVDLDRLFVPVAAASLAQLVEVTGVITELTRILVAPLGLPPTVQLLDDAKLDAAVRDRLAIGNMAAVELACETVGIGAGAHALSAANHEKAPEMCRLLRAQEELIQRIFEPARVVELPTNATPEALLAAVREVDAALRSSTSLGASPFDGAQARQLLELMHKVCTDRSWTHEQLQALAEGCSSDPDCGPELEAAWASWAGLLQKDPNAPLDDDAEDADADMWVQCQDDVEAGADALGHCRLLEARDCLGYAIDVWEANPLPEPESAGEVVRMSAARAVASEYIVEAYCLRSDCAAAEAAAGGGESVQSLGDGGRADLDAALAMDPSCSAAHFRLAKAADAEAKQAATLRGAEAAGSGSDDSDDAAGGDSNAVGVAEAARLARLAKLGSEPAPEPAASSVEAVEPISQALAHAVAGVVIGSEQLPELIELVDMVESLSKEAGRRAAAGLWASKDPKGLPPSWVMASYFDSFGRWLLAPAAAKPPSEEELVAVAKGKRVTLSVTLGRGEFSRHGLGIVTVDAESAVVKVWRERLGDAAADCNAQRYNQAEASLISLAEEILTNPEISSRLRKNADGPTSPSSNEVVGRRALGVAAASLAGRACFLYMEARYADAHEMLNQVLVLEPTNPLWLCQRANVKFDMGKVKLAQADLEAALVLDRRCAAAYLQKGHIELFHGDKTKATPELRYSLAIDDELPLAHVELALALQSGGKGDQALYVLEKAAARFPASVELRCFYAEMVGAGGDLIEAMAQFREVVAMAPQCPLPYLHTALLLASLGDVPSALAHLDAACELCAEGTASESFDAGHVELGTMLMSRDDKEGAAHHFDVAFRSARSLPELEVAAMAKQLAAAQQSVCELLKLPISQVAERLLATQSEIQMMQMQQAGQSGW